MNDVRYYPATVVENEDPDQLHRLRLIIPGITGDETPYPGWVRPRIAGGAGPGAAACWWIPPLGACVTIEVNRAGELRWSGSDLGGVNTVPAFLAANYPLRAGWTSPSGAHAIALDEDAGLLVLVADPADVDGVKNYLALNGETGEWKVGTKDGGLAVLNATQALLMTPAGDTLVLDETNGIVLCHHAGGEMLELKAGSATLTGGSVLVSGGSVLLVGQGGVTIRADLTGVTPTEPLVMGASFLADLLAALPELMAAALAWGLPTTNTATLVANLATSLGLGAPYLSTVSQTE